MSLVILLVITLRVIFSVKKILCFTTSNSVLSNDIEDLNYNLNPNYNCKEQNEHLMAIYNGAEIKVM